MVDALARERRARHAAEAADRQKDRFLVMLGHELRNPLNAVGNAGHLLQRTDLSGAQRDAVIDMLRRQSSQLRRLVDDLLDLGRVLVGKFALRREPVAVHHLLRRAIATMGASGRFASHRIESELEPVIAVVDPVRFEQVFTNLVGNAVRYSPDGGTVRVRLRGRDGRLELSVSDDGIGIDPEQLDRIFELFVQGEPLGGRAEQGLGVGLSMARMLVEAHGGTIEAASEGPGRGSTFVVQIPCVPRADGDGSADGVS